MKKIEFEKIPSHDWGFGFAITPRVIIFAFGRNQWEIRW